MRLEALDDHRLDAEQPCAGGPVADEPVPYSLPATMTSGTPSFLVLHRRIVDRHDLAVGQMLVMPPSMPDTISFFDATLAQVAAIITWWLPRRAP